jgi:hypothetical protein
MKVSYQKRTGMIDPSRRGPSASTMMGVQLSSQAGVSAVIPAEG